MKCQKPWPHCYDTINQSLEEATEQSTTVSSSKSAWRRSSQWLLEDWISALAEGRGAKKIFQCCASQNCSNQFLYLRAVQGHSGDNAIDSALQDNVLLPKGFTGYIYHVGNANELNSFIRNGLMPGGKSLKRYSSLQWTRWKTCMAWRKLQAIWRNQGSSHTRIRGNLFEILYVGAINLKLAQERGLQFYQTRSHAVVLYNTLFAAWIEKAVCMKTKDELYRKVRLTPAYHVS